MANRNFSQFQLTLEKTPVSLWGRYTVGATGAPTIDIPNSKGIKSIVRNGVGKYTITLQDTYIRLLGFNFLSVFATPAAINCFVVSESVGTLAAPTIVVQFQSSAAINVELANGEDIRLQLELKQSSAV